MSFDEGLVLGMLLGGGTGGFNGSLRAVIDDETGVIKIVVGEIVESENTDVEITDETTDEEQLPEEAYTDYEYTYASTTYVKEITTTSTVGDTSTTATETFEQGIITELYNASGDLLMRCDYDEETGEILGFYDGDDIPIYTEEWR